MPMRFWHSQTAGSIALEVNFNQHRRLIADDPTVMAWLDRHNLRRLVFDDTAVRVFDVDLSSDEEADVGVHAEIGADHRFHVDRPPESGGIDQALDARGARASHFEPDVAN